MHPYRYLSLLCSGLVFTLSVAQAQAPTPEETTAPEAAAAPDETAAPAVPPIIGGIEVGGMHHGLTGNLGDWNGTFLRGVFHTGAHTTWNAELNDLHQFGERTQVGAIGITKDLNEDWFASGAVAGSTSGNIQARLKLDLALSRKLLPARNLVATVGAGTATNRDGHHDYSLLFGGAYYFDRPWVLEAGLRLNQSNPGQVWSTGKYVAATYGREKSNVYSLRYGFGSEAYQSIGDSLTLTDFKSKVLTFSWRSWITPTLSLQTRAELYHNPYYDRRGLELSAIKEF